MHTSRSMVQGTGRPALSFGSLWPYSAITFSVTWGICALLILFPLQMDEVFGELSGTSPIFILAVYAPAFAAFFVVARQTGARGLMRYFSRLLLWRCSFGWYAVLLAGIPLMFYGGAWLKGNLFEAPFPFSAWPPLLTALALTMVIGPVEEFGWRGVALPLLQQRFAPIWAGLILGVIWGLWHTPAFLFVGAALIVVWLNGKTMFSKVGALTEVVPSAANKVQPLQLRSEMGVPR